MAAFSARLLTDDTGFHRRHYQRVRDIPPGRPSPDRVSSQTPGVRLTKYLKIIVSLS